MTRLASHRVSPVTALESLVMAPISPAVMQSTSSCFLARQHSSLPRRSGSPVRAFTGVIPAVSLPVMTFTKDSLPTKGSATVLNTKADSGASGSHLMVSPSTVSSQQPSAALGRKCTMASIRTWLPEPVAALPQKTGAMVPLLTPAAIPFWISSLVKGSSMKNFSIRASSVSATASFRAIFISSIRSAAAAGMAISLSLLALGSNL